MAETTKLQLVLSDTEWHAVGAPDDQWCLSCISGTAVDVCITDPDTSPTENTKPYFILGGIVNNIRTRLGYQAWVRSQAGNAIVIQHDADNSGFDEITQLRTSLLKLQTTVVRLEGHLIDNATWRATAIEDWATLKYQLTDRMDRMTLSIARLIDTDVTIIDDLYGMRSKLTPIYNRLMDLELYSVTKEQLEAKILPLQSEIAKCLGLNIDTLNQFVSLTSQVLQCQEDIRALQISDSGDTGSTTELTTEVSTLSSNLLMYWELCIQLVNLSTIEEVETTYQQFLTEHTVPSSMLNILKCVHDQAIVILNNTAVDIEQTQAIDNLEAEADKPIVSTVLNAADLQSLIEG